MPTAWPHFEFNGYVTYLPTESYKYNWDVLFCQTETWVESNYLHLDWMSEWIVCSLTYKTNFNVRFRTIILVMVKGQGTAEAVFFPCLD